MDATENDHRSRKGIRAGCIIRCTVELVVLAFVGLSIFNYFIFDVPDYADEENELILYKNAMRLFHIDKSKILE